MTTRNYSVGTGRGVIIAAALLGGCAAMERATLREEARQLAWTGPGAGPCLFGGVTERAVEHCARINFGTRGLLVAVNERVRARLDGRECTEHVAALRVALARHKDLRTEPIYTCPAALGELDECHVSLLVTSRDGERFVLDDGAVVDGWVGVGGVASLAAFEAVVDNALWVGRPPTSGEVAAAMRRAAR